MSEPLVNFAGSIRALSWADMVKISEYICDQVPDLIKSEKLDRDGMAHALVDMAVDIETEAQKEQNDGL